MNKKGQQRYAIGVTAGIIFFIAMIAIITGFGIVDENSNK